MTPTKKEPPRMFVPVAPTSKTQKRLHQEPVAVDLLDLLLGDSDDAVRDVAGHAASSIEHLFDIARDRPTIPLPPVVSIGAHLRDTIDDIRFLIGDGVKVGLVVVLSDRDRFDNINLPGQLEAGCDEHGLRVKVFSQGDLKIVVMNVSAHTPPCAEAGPSPSRMRQPEDGDCRRAAAHF